MFKVICNLENVCETEILDEAIKEFMTSIQNLHKKGMMTFQLLETACWMEKDNSYYADFYTARDWALQKGILIDNKIV